MAAAVLYVKNLAAMKRFYERCCGMSAQPSDTDGVCVLTSPDWELSLVRVDLAAEIVISDPPQRLADNPIRHLDCLDPKGNVVQLRQRLPAA
jgi:hypothetical protein